MKKIIVVVMILAMAAILTGCGQNSLELLPGSGVSINNNETDTMNYESEEVDESGDTGSVDYEADGDANTENEDEKNPDSQTSNDTEESSDSESGTDAVSSETGSVVVEITPPDGWEKIEGSVIAAQYMKNTASFMVKDEPFDRETLDDVVSDAIDIYQGAFDNFKVLGEVEPLTIDEKDARKMTFTCTVSGMNMKFVYVYLFVADNTYVITFGDLETTFDTLTNDYDTILNDIKFVTE